jgi:uncharacterized protein (TIGR00645 family)
MRPRFNSILRAALLGSRWGMAPFCLGLIAALLIVLVQFFCELAHVVAGFAAMGDSDVILAVLKLVDLVLIANLVVMIIAAAVEIFLPTAAHQRYQDEGAGDIADIAALKPRLFASISAIAAIDLLESFINVDRADKSDVLWEIAILLAFVVSGVALAWMERLGAERH